MPASVFSAVAGTAARAVQRVSPKRRNWISGTVAASLNADIGFSPRLVLGAGCGCLLAVLAWHFVHRDRPEVVGFLVITMCAAIWLAAGVEELDNAWVSTPGEQALLRLLPDWPREGRVKVLIVGALALTQADAWLAWSIVSAVAWILGWIVAPAVLIGAVLLLATSCAWMSASCARLARSSVGTWHVWSVFCLLCAVAGVVLFTLQFGNGGSTAIAFALILGPLLTSVTMLYRRPLLFPVIGHGLSDER
jgi:hypothetical protein